MSQNRRSALHYERHFPQSTDDRTTLVLIHEVGLDMKCWDAIIPELTESYHVICYDLRGHGLNKCEPDEKLTWELLCDDFEHFIQYLGLQSVHLIGHGIGANIAVKAALRQPSLVLSLVILSAPGYIPKGFVERTLQHRRSLLETTTREQFAKNMVQSISVQPFDSKAVQRLFQAFANIPAATYLQFMQLFLESDMVPDFQALQHPTLVLAGEFDAWYTPALSAVTASYLTSSRFLVVPNAGSAMFIDSPKMTAQWIINHIAQRGSYLNMPPAMADTAEEPVRKQLLHLIGSGKADLTDGHELIVQAMDTFRVYVNGNEINDGWSTLDAQSLLLYLLLHPTSVKQRIIDTLWPDIHVTQAEQRLQTSVYYLKRLLESMPPGQPDRELIVIQSDRVLLRGHIECDLIHFIRTLREVDSLPDQVNPEPYALALINCLPCSLLCEFTHPWVQSLREQLSAQVEEKIQLLAAKLSDQGNHIATQRLLQRVSLVLAR